MFRIISLSPLSVRYFMLFCMTVSFGNDYEIPTNSFIFFFLIQDLVMNILIFNSCCLTLTVFNIPMLHLWFSAKEIGKLANF